MFGTVNAINDLRTYGYVLDVPYLPVAGDVVYVNYHTYHYDGGGGFFYFIPEQQYETDDDGIIIQRLGSVLEEGTWVRKFDGYISIRFYGSIGGEHADDGERIQKAIDYAANNLLVNAYTKSSTVYIPSGSYRINNTLVLKTGVSLLGDSMINTFLKAGYDITNTGWMMVMDEGRIEGCNIANIAFSGRVPVSDPAVTDTITKGCMEFKAIKSGEDGGMWNCTFKNIHIYSFNGPAIHLVGGSDYDVTNQLCVFENVYATRQKDAVRTLLMQGLQGQFTFINCGFGGITYGSPQKTTKGSNVMITADPLTRVQTAVVSFNTCTFQNGEYGIYIESCESITMDTCWFETLDMAVTAVVNTYGDPCRGINVLNSRFTNAAGFGSINIVNRNTTDLGRCITSVGAEINVYNNYVLVSDINAVANSPLGKFFILAFMKSPSYPFAGQGVRTSGNSFQDNRLGYSNGIAQPIIADNDPLYTTVPPKKYINIKDNKLVFVTGSMGSPVVIERIDSSISAGETICVRADLGGIQFNNAKNIFLSGKASITLDSGDMATFVKIDNTLSKGGFNFSETFQLIALYKSTSDT